MRGYTITMCTMTLGIRIAAWIKRDRCSVAKSFPTLDDVGLGALGARTVSHVKSTSCMVLVFFPIIPSQSSTSFVFLQASQHASTIEQRKTLHLAFFSCCRYRSGYQHQARQFQLLLTLSVASLRAKSPQKMIFSSGIYLIQHCKIPRRK